MRSDSASLHGVSPDAPTLPGVSADPASLHGVSPDAPTLPGVSADPASLHGVSPDAPTLPGVSADPASLHGVSPDAPTLPGVSADPASLHGVSPDAPTLPGVSADPASLHGVSPDAPTLPGVSADPASLHGVSPDAPTLPGVSADPASLHGVSPDAPTLPGVSADPASLHGVSPDAPTLPGVSADPASLHGVSPDAPTLPGVSADPASLHGVSPDAPTLPGVSADPASLHGVSPDAPTLPGVSADPASLHGVSPDAPTLPGVSADPASLHGVSPDPTALPAPVERSRPATAPEQRLLCGWGRTAPTRAWLLRPRTPEEVADALDGSPAVLAARSACRSPRGGAIARGAGRSYGDAAQCGGGLVIDATALRGTLALDATRGVVRAGAGSTFAELLLFLAARGFTLPVVPGTRHVTVGGALAADVHGKNHLRDGSLSRHVESFTLCTPADGLRPVSPEREGDLFDATLGGMGLTGVVVDAALRVVPLRSAGAVADIDRLDRLEQAVALLAGVQSHRYAIAWVDLLSEGAAFGRSVLTRSDEGPPASEDALFESPALRHGRAGSPPGARGRRPPGGLATEAGRHRPLVGIPVSTSGGGEVSGSAGRGAEGPGAAPFSLRPRLTVPRGFPGGLLRPAVVRAFNALHWRSAPRHARGRSLSMSAQLFPLDALGDWSRLYGPAGLLQYQFAVPLGQEDALLHVVHRLRARHLPMYLAVLKRFGPGGPGKSGPLSFPLAGLTLAIDLPAGAPGLYGALEEADALVVGAGGRVYLAKDARLRAPTLAAMYPDLERFRELRARVDPDGVLRSDLGRRLGLCR